MFKAPFTNTDRHHCPCCLILTCLLSYTRPCTVYRYLQWIDDGVVPKLVLHLKSSQMLPSSKYDDDESTEKFVKFQKFGLASRYFGVSLTFLFVLIRISRQSLREQAWGTVRRWLRPFLLRRGEEDDDDEETEEASCCLSSFSCVLNVWLVQNLLAVIYARYVRVQILSRVWAGVRFPSCNRALIFGISYGWVSDAREYVTLVCNRNLTGNVNIRSFSVQKRNAISSSNSPNYKHLPQSSIDQFATQVHLVDYMLWERFFGFQNQNGKWVICSVPMLAQKHTRRSFGWFCWLFSGKTTLTW